MQFVAERQLGLLAVLVTALLVAALIILPIELAPVVLLAAAGVVVFVLWSVMGSLLFATFMWFVAVIAFDEEFWRAEVPFFFNVTISRILVVVVGLLLVAMWVLGRSRLRSAHSVIPLMAVVLGYFTVSAIVTGFETIAVATVHYRLIGGYWFAFAIFFVMLHAVREERDIARLLKFFFWIGLYLTITGWCEHFKLWDLVFPRYVADPEKGIHFGRVRGPFLVSPTVGIALLFCYFTNLVLTRHTTGIHRLVLYGTCVLMLPVIFWTKTRSVWLGMVLATIVWVAYTRRRWSRAAAIGILASAAMVAGVWNIENILSRKREVGGVTDPVPIYLRIGLAMITWDIFEDCPVFGVGFGHFRDVAPRYAREVDSPFYTFASPAMEHNNFLSILAETGVIGLGVYVVLLIAILKLSIRLYQKLPTSAPGFVGRDVIVLFWVLFVIYNVDSMFRETSVHPFTNSLFFGISGVVAALDWMLRPQPLPPRAAWVASSQGGMPEEVVPAGPEPGS